MVSLRRAYFDSTMFVDMVKTDLGKAIEADREADVWTAKRLMEAHRDKEIQVLTSILTIAECTHGGDGDISERARFLMDKLLTSGDYVHLVETTPFIAKQARDLRWDHNINLKGPDGVHAASAISRQCEEFVTSNGRFNRLHVHQAAFQQLGLKIIRARDSQLLPTKYRQLGLGNGIN
jgi:hypothetical protein